MTGNAGDISATRPWPAFYLHASDARAALEAMHRSYLDALPRTMIELVHTRVSQLNGCAYCLDMHTKDAVHHGESTQRLHQLAGWRHSTAFEPQERAALALAEEATRLDGDGVSDTAWEAAAEHFNPSELAALVAAIACVNAWNRINVAIKLPGGTYEPT